MYRLKKFIVEQHKKYSLFINSKFHSYAFSKDILNISRFINGRLYKYYEFNANNELREYTIYKAISYSKRTNFANGKIKCIEYLKNRSIRRIVYNEDGTIQHDTDWYRPYNFDLFFIA